MKCTSCGITIPEMPEDATYDMLLCDSCYNEHSMANYYCGIGSRATPKDILEQMRGIADVLARAGYILRSGGAQGADTAFADGSDNKKEIYMPWKDFNGIDSSAPCYIYPPTKRAIEIAKQFHPAWNRCSQGAQKLHARNSHQVLGKDCNTPSEFVICWHPGSGGTMQAVRIAKHYKIPVYNLAENDDQMAVETVLRLITREETDMVHQTHVLYNGVKEYFFISHPFGVTFKIKQGFYTQQEKQLTKIAARHLYKDCLAKGYSKRKPK